MIDTKKLTNKYQHNLIVLISTLAYMNSKFKKYTQSNILYYFNNNLRKNGQKPIKLKTLQSYLYKLEKIFKVTNNYYRHLGENYGTEINYKLIYPKKICYYKINKHFRDKKEARHQQRANVYHKKTCIKNGNVEKWECIYNNIINNNREKKEIEKLQLEKYAMKCRFKTKNYLSILNSKETKDIKIEKLRALKKEEIKLEKISKTKQKESKLAIKQKKLNRMLDETKARLEIEGYNSEQLEVRIKEIYEQYKNKPHFIIENNKYNDLRKIIGKLKKIVEHERKNVKENEKNIRNNVFSILLEQLKHKIDIQKLIPILKGYLNKRNKLEYREVLSNYYYYDILELAKEADYLRIGEEYEKIVT
ncbi:hypothetical protein F9Y90_05305 (plasmid) [Borrelia miyamotoi]|uniref:Plasmid maintenance protein n=1 Tax=Borrelia miyamotoi TaxID=47466 RepID=A0A5P8ARD2_9SPIR|nr:plasmid maintenance protein [Borrelia miyamotoi]ATQ19038.1 plasmid maintenance protein [Borrelia miyamotoi]QFP42516.1 hypothetical protein F9Y90_05305 [Borrelia miyamotoi]WAZ72842.1 plasmid maintenance protein [Borrelia miyamotoi]WVI05454.1 plasmid maintenance protein [Borrelia miyamotoi]